LAAPRIVRPSGPGNLGDLLARRRVENDVHVVLPAAKSRLLAAEVHRNKQRLPIHGDREPVWFPETILFRRVHLPENLAGEHVVGGELLVAQLRREKALRRGVGADAADSAGGIGLRESPEQMMLSRG